MQLEVTQQNLHLFLPGKIANVAAIIADKTHCSVAEAMQRFYASNTPDFITFLRHHIAQNENQ